MSDGQLAQTHEEWAKTYDELQQLRDKLEAITSQPVTDQQIEDIEKELGMGYTAWDMVHPKELVSAVLKVMLR